MQASVFTPKSEKSDSSKKDKDFSSMVEPKYYKRRSTMLLTPSDINSEESDTNKRPNVFASEENEREIIYNDLLTENLMIFVTNIRNIDGGWRHHLLLIKNFEETLHLFYMPEIHNQLVPIVLDLLMTGNTSLRIEASKFLAKVIKLQHHMPYREELINFIKQNLAVSTNNSLRRTFIEFCKSVITLIPYELFRKFFFEDLL